MTAIERAARGDDSSAHPLQHGASPAVVRSWLGGDDRDRFVAEYEAALDEARRTLELGGVHDVVERWRLVAGLQTDPAAFRRSVRHVAEIMSGETPAEDEPLEVTRARAGM